jgi:phage terminase large subunit
LSGRLAEVQLPAYAGDLWEPVDHVAWHGGRGGAKSWTVADYLLIDGAENERRAAGCREIQRNISESVKQGLDDAIVRLGMQDYYESTNDKIYGLRNNTLFTFMGLWRNPAGIKSLEGYDRCWVEEANKASQRSIDILIPTLRKEGRKFIWTWNREYDHDPVDKMFLGEKGPPPNSIVRKVGWQDNPWFPEVLRKQMEHDYATNPEKAEHVWGGELVRAVEGAYYTKALRAAREQQRFTSLALDPNFQVKAYWDLGHSDATAVWVVQTPQERIHVIDYCEGSGQPPAYYMNWLRNSGYEGCLCVLPHDGAAVHPDNPIAMSYEHQLRQAGFQAKVIRNQGKGAAMMRKDAALRVFPRIWFDEDKTRHGVKALGHYHEKRSEDERHVGLGPEHDWSSHGADAFGLMAIDYAPPQTSIGGARLSPRVGTIA